MNMNNSGYSTVLCRQKHHITDRVQIDMTAKKVDLHVPELTWSDGMVYYWLTVWHSANSINIYYIYIIDFYHIGGSFITTLLEVDASFCSSSPFLDFAEGICSSQSNFMLLWDAPPRASLLQWWACRLSSWFTIYWTVHAADGIYYLSHLGKCSPI